MTKRVTASSKPNLWFGVRNKYTMENDENWRKSNKLAGNLMMTLGAIMIMPCFIYYENSFKFYMYYTNILTIVGLTIMAIVVSIYSKKIYQDQKQNQNQKQ